MSEIASEIGIENTLGKQTPESGTAADGTADKGRGPKRKHGKGFIYMSLNDADDALRKIDQHAKEMSKEGFARALGHDAPTGRFPHKLEALKSYTLIEIENDTVRLTPLATDMLYGGNEAVRVKARATAFLAYDDFKRTFVECPKGQDHQMAYLLDYVKAKLGIVNEVDKFQRLFLESAYFAGLLEGEPNLTAKTIRLRPAILEGGNGTPSSEGLKQSPSNDFVPVPLEDVGAVMESFGLTTFRDRSELTQRTRGTVTLKAGEGRITLEVQRPIQITIKANDLLTDLPALILALREKGFQA